MQKRKDPLLKFTNYEFSALINRKKKIFLGKLTRQLSSSPLSKETDRWYGICFNFPGRCLCDTTEYNSISLFCGDTHATRLGQVLPVFLNSFVFTTALGK